MDMTGGGLKKKKKNSSLDSSETKKMTDNCMGRREKNQSKLPRRFRWSLVQVGTITAVSPGTSSPKTPNENYRRVFLTEDGKRVLQNRGPRHKCGKRKEENLKPHRP